MATDEGRYDNTQGGVFKSCQIDHIYEFNAHEVITSGENCNYEWGNSELGACHEVNMSDAINAASVLMVNFLK